jgi:hypothetical protein
MKAEIKSKCLPSRCWDSHSMGGMTKSASNRPSSTTGSDDCGSWTSTDI